MQKYEFIFFFHKRNYGKSNACVERNALIVIKPKNIASSSAAFSFEGSNYFSFLESIYNYFIMRG